MKKPFVLVVVPFKGNPKYTLDFLYSMMHIYASGFSYSVLLWDDGSSEEDLNYLYSSITNTYGPNHFIIIKHDNVGYTQSVINIVNLAKGQVEYDYLLLANNDLKIRPGCFYSLINRMKSNPNIAVVGGKIIKMGTDIIQHTGTRLENCEIVDPYCGLNEKDPITMNVERRLWVNGACSLYNLRILRKENLNFSEEFLPAYFEESDLQTELNMRGYSILYEPRAEIEHMVGGTMGQEKQKYEKIFWTNWEKYLNKWKPRFDSKQLQF